jgi:DNA-binding PadR family transcriptional regulator
MAVLRALAADPGSWRYGYELGLEVGLKAGSLYPILMRLADRGLLDAEWEEDGPAGRPPRHLYRLTGAGVAYAGQWISAAPAAPAARPGRSAPPRAGRPAPGRRRPQPGLGGA